MNRAGQANGLGNGFRLINLDVFAWLSARNCPCHFDPFFALVVLCQLLHVVGVVVLAQVCDKQQLMRVYGALMWSLGKVLDTPEVTRVYIGEQKNSRLLTHAVHRFQSTPNRICEFQGRFERTRTTDAAEKTPISSTRNGRTCLRICGCCRGARYHKHQPPYTFNWKIDDEVDTYSSCTCHDHLIRNP